MIALPASGLWVVADGMGGHQAGDFASQTITQQSHSVGMSTGLQDLEARFMSRLTDAHDVIRDHAAALGGGTVGATVVGFLVSDDDYACIWSGDSRIYLYRGGQMAQQTLDHTEVQHLLNTGAIDAQEALNWPRRNVITRAIGVSDEPQCDMVEGKLGDGDVFLLCSDGLTEHIPDEELAHAMGHVAAGEDVQQVCNGLIEQTLARGAKDNVTCIIVQLRAQSDAYL